MDLQIHQQNKTKSATAVWVQNTANAINKIHAAIRIYENSYEAGVAHPDLSVQVQQLRASLNSPDLQKLASELEKVLRSTSDPEQRRSRALKTLQNMLERKEQLLVEKVAEDVRENSTFDRRLIFTSVLDIFLLLTLGGLFAYDRSISRKTRRALLKTLQGLQDTNDVLTAREWERTAQIRATVHDLKNPLGSIRGFAELLEESDSRTSINELSHTIQRISNNTIDLVNSLITDSKSRDLQKIIAQLEPVNIVDSISEVCQILTPIADEKNQKLHVTVPDEPMNVHADEKRLQNAFLNLIGNGLKFSPIDATVSVRCHRHGQRVSIEIEDTGPGMTRDDCARAFLPGQKLSARPTGNETSTGMGLFSARRDIEAHQGRVGIKWTKPGVGTCFFVELPLSLAEKSPTLAMKEIPWS